MEKVVIGLLVAALAVVVPAVPSYDRGSDETASGTVTGVVRIAGH